MMNHGGMAVALVGPTASGKSALSHELALEMGDVEILCVDAMTVYKGMDIGTAKPSKQEQKEVPYHLIDLIEPNDEFTRTRFINTMTPLFEFAKQNGGLYDYLLICDERNNTPEVIDSNELHFDAYLKPTRTAEFIILTFTATRSDANFQELI